jgi:preprotein translocase subunit SecB
MTKQEEKKPQVIINAQYVKDLSFESPDAPFSFARVKEAPKIDLSLDVQVKAIEKDNYEVTIAITAKAIIEKENETLFISELQYSGLFTVSDCENEEQKEQILLIYCPNLIFPFARRIIADASRDGGFQPLMINPVDFAALYLQHKQDKSKSN